MTARRRRTGACLLAPLAMALAACGTTVRAVPEAAPGAPAGGESLSAPVVPGASAEPGLGGSAEVPGGTVTTGGSGTSSGGFGSGSSSTSGGTSSGSTGTGGSSSGRPTRTTTTATAPGITATHVYVGAPYFPDVSATNQALGGSDAADQRAMFRALANDLNKRGGIKGRKLEPIFFEYSAASNEPIESQSQAACEHWTKDNKVFAIFMRGPTLLECAKKAGALVTSGLGATGPIYRANPHLVDPGGIRPERMAGVTVRGLYDLGWGKPTAPWLAGKVGIISWDDANYRYGVDKGYLPALKGVGVTPTDVRYVSIPQTAGAIADSSAAVSSAVLRFADAGIDHVFIQDGPAGVFGGAGLTTLFLSNAESQRYYPRYGFNGDNAPNYQAYPNAQQVGMVAIDYLDYMPQFDTGIKPNPHRERCFKIMAGAGVGLADQNAMGNAAQACEAVWFVERLLKDAPSLTRDAALQVAAGLGASFGSPYTYGTRLSGTKRDGVAQFRAAQYDQGCDCMRYLSPPREVVTD